MNKIEDIKDSKKELNENIRNIEKEIENKKTIPKEEKSKIIKKVFENIFISVIIMAFLLFISLGSLNIDTTIYITELKVLSVVLIVFTILLFEYSYKKENGNMCIHGIECFALALFTLLSRYLYTIYFKEFQFIVAIAALIVVAYYGVKSFVIYIKMKNKYFAELNDINEIIKK